MHPCEQIYKTSGESIIYGKTPGICRITGKQALGIPFNSWVRDTFTDHSYLLSGDIISNEALFCFDESSTIIQKLTGRDKPQRFRTYSHIIAEGKWYILTKADKQLMYELICNKNCELICLADSGQKHILFKHKPGLWQLEEMQILPDLELFKELYKVMMKLLELGFSQGEIISGHYINYRIIKAGLNNWLENEDFIKKYRGTKLFKFSTWLMYSKQN